MYLPATRMGLPEEISSGAYRKLFVGIRSITPLHSDTEAAILSNSRLVLYQPKDILVDYGEVCDHCLFCVKGLVSSRFILDGLEKTVWFMAAGDPIVAVDSWFDQVPSDEKLTAIKETLCVAINRVQMIWIEDHHPDFLQFMKKITERQLQLIVKRTKWQQFTTEGKIKNLRELYPHLWKVLSKTELAGYLGITRETLSRLLVKMEY